MKDGDNLNKVKAMYYIQVAIESIEATISKTDATMITIQDLKESRKTLAYEIFRND